MIYVYFFFHFVQMMNTSYVCYVRKYIFLKIAIFKLLLLNDVL